MKDQLVFKRHELKYRITKEQKELILKAMEGHMVPDKYGRSTIFSLYFDTPDYLLIRRSIEKPVYKEKIRLRSYGLAEGKDVFLELKKKYDKVVYKRRIKITEQKVNEYLLSKDGFGESQVAKELDFSFKSYRDLAPRMLLMYDRMAYYDEFDSDFRITFDENIRFRLNELNLHTDDSGVKLLPADECLMEIKTAKAIPLWMVEVLSENKIYKTSFSKYGSAYVRTMERLRATEAKVPQKAAAFNKNNKNEAGKEILNYA